MPLTTGACLPKSSLSTPQSGYFPFTLIQLKQSPSGKFLHFLSVSMSHCLFLYCNRYFIAYWNCSLAGLSPWSQELWLLHPHVPHITYSIWHFRNPEHSVCLFFNKGSTYSSVIKRLKGILTMEYYLVVL
jgi:hypothetical protein